MHEKFNRIIEDLEATKKIQESIGCVYSGSEESGIQSALRDDFVPEITRKMYSRQNLVITDYREKDKTYKDEEMSYYEFTSVDNINKTENGRLEIIKNISGLMEVEEREDSLVIRKSELPTKEEFRRLGEVGVFCTQVKKKEGYYNIVFTLAPT